MMSHLAMMRSFISGRVSAPFRAEYKALNHEGATLFFAFFAEKGGPG